MRIGPITSAIISPIQTKKQAEIESLPKNTSDVKEQQSFSTTTGGDPKINTQDFIALRVGGAKEPSFVELDEAIKRINENIEKVGEALEGFIKKIRETSKETIGLQLLQKTFEAIDKIREGNK